MSLFTSTGCCCEGDPCVIIPLGGINFDIISGDWIFGTGFSGKTTLTNTSPGTILYNTPALSVGQKISGNFSPFSGTVRLIIDALDEDNYLAGEVSMTPPGGTDITFKIIKKTGGTDSILISRTVSVISGQSFVDFNRFTFCFNPVTGWAVLDGYTATSGPVRTQIQTTVSGNDFVGFYAEKYSFSSSVKITDYFALNVYGTSECEPCINAPLPQCTRCPTGVRPQTMFVTFGNVQNLITNPSRCSGNCGQFNTTFALPVIPTSICDFHLALDPDICAGDVSFGSDPNKGYTSIRGAIRGPTQPYSVTIFGAVPANNNETIKVTFGFSLFAGKPAPAGHPTCQPPGLNLFFLSQVVNSPCNWAAATCLVSF